MAPGVDLSQTVGWFTTKYPVCLSLGSAVVAAGGGRGRRRWGRRSSAPKSSFARFPTATPTGCCATSTARLICEGPDPPIGFNYLGRGGGRRIPRWPGRAGGSVVRAGLFADAARAGWPMPLVTYRAGQRGHVDTDAGPQLQANWSWASSKFDAAGVAQLSRLWFEALAGICAMCNTVGAGSPHRISRSNQHVQVARREPDPGAARGAATRLCDR